MAKRVRVVYDPPVDPRHGVHKDRVFDVLAHKSGEGESPAGWWVMGDDGKPVLVMNYEGKEEEDGCEPS